MSVQDVEGVQTEDYQPRLQVRDQVWRLAISVAFSAVSWGAVVAQQSGTRRVVDVACGVLALALVTQRRRWPVAVAVVTALLTMSSATASGPSILAAVSLASRRRPLQILLVAAVSVASAEVYSANTPSLQSGPVWATHISNIVLVSAVLTFGMYIGSRRELLWNLRRRIQVAESERDLRTAQTRLEERSRIAREMHDVLAHRISQISVQAGALHYRTNLTDDEVRDSVGFIRESAHHALIDLRGVLGVLRDESGQLHSAPQPTYVDLADLVEEARRSGMRITYSDEVVDEPVTDAAGRTLYRIVQEGITNARKHASGADLEVDLRGSPNEGISVKLTNALGFERFTVPVSGLGLVGLRERAHLRGGRLEHGPRDDDFVLEVWIPWTP